MFRLTGNTAVDIVLIFFWWPIAASLLLTVGLCVAVFHLISRLNRHVEQADRRTTTQESTAAENDVETAAQAHTRRLAVTDSDRRAAVDAVTRRLSSDGVITKDRLDELAELTVAIGGARSRGELAEVAAVPLETFGPIKSPPEPIQAVAIRVGPAVAAALGLVLLAIGGVGQQFGVAFLGCLAVIAATVVWTWRKARGSRVWKTVGMGLLAWTVTLPVAAIIAPPEPSGAGPRVRSWAEWCATYGAADGSLTVGPADIRAAVLGAEQLPVPADTAAAREVGYAVTLVGSDARSYAYSNSYNQRAAAEHMTKVAAAVCPARVAATFPSAGITSTSLSPADSLKSAAPSPPATTMPPASTPAGAAQPYVAPPVAPVQTPTAAQTHEGVTPGAFCKKADEGDYGRSDDGDLYRCTTDGAGSDQPKWMPV